MLKGTNKHFNLIFRLVCFLLVVTSFTCIAFARFVSSHTPKGTATISGVRGSISVNREQSGSLFYNSDYIIGTTVMNHPYVTDFTLSNCNLDDSGNLLTDDPAQVDLACEAVFYIPKELAQVAAFQLTAPQIDTESGLTVAETQVTPIYTLADFIATTDGQTVTLPKQSAEGAYENYGMTLTLGENGEPTVSETFTVSKGTTDGGKLMLQAKDETAKVTLTIEEETLDTSMTYIFQCFDRKVVLPDADLPVLKKPLTAQCEQKAPFYKIRLLHPGLIRAGGSEDTDIYRLRLIPTEKLGNYGEPDETGVPDYSIESNMPFEKWYELKQDAGSTLSFSYDEDADNAGVTAVTDTNGNIQYYKVTGNKVAADETVVPNNCIAKDYPIRINAIFTQASTSPQS